MGRFATLATTNLLAINWEPEIRGVLIVVIAISLFCGSIYLLLAEVGGEEQVNAAAEQGDRDDDDQNPTDLRLPVDREEIGGREGGEPTHLQAPDVFDDRL